MQYFKSIGGMIQAILAENGEIDDNGNPIVASEVPMNEEEYMEYRKNEVEKQLSMFKLKGDEK